MQAVDSRQALSEPDAFHQAMNAIFHPKRIAIVGASQRPGFANSIQRLILKGGYEGEVFGVNPRYDEVMGCPCYPTIDAIPGGADKAIVVVPSQHVMGVLDQAEKAGVKAVNIITSGFGEQSDDDAHERQNQIRDFARRTGIRIVGPNCLGIISTPAKMIAKSGPYDHVNRGPVGIVFQSGLLAYSAVIPPTDRGFGYSYIVTTGNEADLDATDFMRYYIEDDETRVLGCFIEQFRDADKLREVADLAANAGKPLVVLKIGRSEGGQRAARAHTGSLVGSDDVIDTVMRQLGIIRVYGQAYPNKVDLDSPVGKVMKAIPEKYPDKMFLILSLVTGKVQEGYRADQPPVEPVMEWDGVPFLQGTENGLRAIRHMNRYAEFLRGRTTTTDEQRGPSPVAERAVAIVRAANGRPLVEREAKQLLSLYDIPVTQERLVTSADDAVAAAESIGYPVVLKIESPDIAHKTEAGGVLLNLADEQGVRHGYDQIVANAKAYNADADIRGVLVQQMVSGGKELILGMTQDPTFGPAIAVGLGGIFVEILKDVQLGIPPLTEGMSREMISRLRGKAILEGARGEAASDVSAVVNVLGCFSQLCLDLRDEVAEIDINPLLVFEDGNGACVVDCLIVPTTRDA